MNQDRASVVVGFWYYSPYLRGRACCPVLHETSAISSGILVNRLPCGDPGVRALTRHDWHQGGVSVRLSMRLTISSLNIDISTYAERMP